jgi:SnoaL-like domain
MEQWELVARESIRDLVARYNASGDAGRFAEVRKLFAADAVMKLEGDVYNGIEEVMSIFTGTRDTLVANEADVAPIYLRHMTATHQIDLADEDHAAGRCYFQVLTRIGLDHWGRYIDQYRRVEGRWVFAVRDVRVDGRSPNCLFGEA